MQVIIAKAAGVSSPNNVIVTATPLTPAGAAGNATGVRRLLEASGGTAFSAQVGLAGCGGACAR